MIPEPRAPEGTTSRIRWLRQLLQWCMASRVIQIEGFDRVETTKGTIYRPKKTMGGYGTGTDNTTPKWG